MINHLNNLDSRLIVTIEDPIEYLYEDNHCVITQREVGSDTPSFASALKHSLRQDVDVILVGELRDLETIEACLTAAETGHLVLSTLHTSGAPMTIDRIVDAFPPHQQAQVRMQLSLTLAGVISQFLLPRRDEEGRIPAVEVMIANSAVRNLIRKGKTHQLPNVIQTRGSEGMQSMEQALKELYMKGVISQEDATATANDPDNLNTLMSNG
jgi:twitching motility protein PilT